MLTHPPGIYALLAGLGGLVIGATLGAAAWLVTPAGVAARTAAEVTITIPPGTATRLAAGEPVTVTPPTVGLTAGDRVVVTNRDSVAHLVGQHLIEAGETAVIRFEQPGVNRLLCTFHPAGSLEFAVGARPPLVESLLVVGATLGVPLAAVSGGITYLVSRFLT